MKCEQIREWIGNYWDFSETDLRKHAVNKHILNCPECHAEFVAWEESNMLIRDSFEEPTLPESDSFNQSSTGTTSVSTKVMERIYTTDSWRRPIAQRNLSISYRSFRQLAMAASFFLAMFIVSFTYSILFPPITEQTAEPLVGISEVASSTGGAMQDISGATAMASITVPIKLSPIPEQGELNYLMILSLVGIITIIMLMNWFSRIRA